MALDDLKEVIETLQGMIDVHRDYLSAYETRTRQVLIDPLLQALGWDVWDPGVVQLEYKLREERRVAPQLSVVGIKCLKLWAKSQAHPKMSYIGNTPRNPVFIEDFSDECLVAV